MHWLRAGVKVMNLLQLTLARENSGIIKYRGCLK
jgi:hypothetical protein